MKKCRFHFGRIFYNITIIAVPLPNDLLLEIKTKIMQNRISITENVQRYTDTKPNPCKNNFFDKTRDDFKE